MGRGASGRSTGQTRGPKGCPREAMSDVRIEARVIIREIHNDRTARATLPNGKVILVFARKRDPVPELRVGDEWTVLLSLCDFSCGRLVQAPPPLLLAGASNDS